MKLTQEQCCTLMMIYVYCITSNKTTYYHGPS